MFDDRQAESETERRAERLSQIYADPLRHRIVGECNLREMSPRSYHRLIGGAPLEKVEHAFGMLVQYGWLEQARVEERDGEEAGEVERFYRATESLVWDEETIEALPESVSAVIAWRVLEQVDVRAKEARKAGTLFRRADTHLSCSPLELDRQGWDAVIARVDAVFGTLAREQEEARVRMAESGEEPIPMTVSLLAFESPPLGWGKPGATPPRRRLDSLA